MSLTLAVKPTLVDRIVPRSLTADILLVVGGVALTALAAQLQFSVPGVPVPFTFQTLAVLLTGAALGSTRGAISMALYAIAGLAFPIFSGASQGPAVLFGVTGGYIFGFVLAAYLVGFLAERNFSSNFFKMAIAYVVGSAAIYAVGVPVLAIVAFNGDLFKAAQAGLFPFLIWDAAKAIIAGGLLPAAWALVRKVKGN